MPNLLEVRKINKAFGPAKVVRDVSFEVKRGEILGLLGPNGAGKTTTIRMIMGITGPDEGELRFILDGATSNIPKSRVGYLPEERGLYKEARVLDVLVFLAGLKGIDKETAAKCAREWLAKFGLERHARSRVDQLSKGMAQKIQLIAAVLHKPDLLVLDEPFSGLDPVSQDLFKEEIRGLAARGAAVLLSSHQMNLVEETCDHIFLISEGARVLYGPVSAIKARYGNYRVHIVAAGDIEDICRSALVESFTRSGVKWVLRLKESVTPGAFLASLPAAAPIDELSVARISLHDIFVRMARGGAEDGADLAGDPVGNCPESA